MTKLTGQYRGTNTSVNYNDIRGRENGILFLKEVFGWDMESNEEQYQIDLLRINGRGGVDVEEGKWEGYYRYQYPENFNKFTLDFPSANFPGRKEKYFNEYFDMISKEGRPYVHHSPDYSYNSILRFNSDFTECFFVDHSAYSDPNKLVKSMWKAHTVTTGEPELWMCWRLNDIPFFILKNGRWVEDKTLQNSNEYEKLLQKYNRAKQNYLNTKNV